MSARKIDLLKKNKNVQCGLNMELRKGALMKNEPRNEGKDIEINLIV